MRTLAPSPSRVSFLLCCSAFALTSAAGCDSGPACAVDTDCALGDYCSLAGECLPLGTMSGQDAGLSGSDSGPRDAPAGDAAPRTDAPVDAPMMATDAPIDASVCPDLVGTYMLTRIGVECTGLGATTIAFTGPAPSECAYEVSLDDRSAGVLAYVGGAFSGTLTLVAGMPTDCGLTAGALRGDITITCGACAFDATSL